MRAAAASDISAAEKQALAEKIVRENPLIFRQQTTDMPGQRPTTVEGVITWLEQLFVEEALQAAPDEKTRKFVEQTIPLREVEVEPLRPILIAPRPHRSRIIVTRDAEQQGYTPWWKNAQKKEVEEEPTADIPLEVEKGSGEEVVADELKVEVLADEKVTAEMHDDTTVLRDVEDDEGDLVIFDALHVWMGGAGQLDGYVMDDLYLHDAGGDQRSDVRIRRAEGIVRATLADLGEIKLQYDIDSGIFRDLYWRLVSESSSRTLTIGNQKESMGLDFLMGNKFGTAMERSAPASAFGSYRSMGVRYNRWFNLSPEQTAVDMWGQDSTYLTTSVGVYTKDIEDSHDTDWALTGRVSSGAQRENNAGIHLGVSASYREGDFTRIAGRPELQEASRIQLATFEADQQAVVGLEAMYSMGSLHSQAEFYYSDYRGGPVNGEGFGGYAQLGWILGDNQRTYNARWGVWAPINVRNRHVFEIFTRFSYTRGEDDEHPWNDLRILTLGGNWYYRQFRGSVNLLLARTRRDVEGEDAGNALAARIQYLF
jgi:phosphate-selective porin OprO/OprP